MDRCLRKEVANGDPALTDAVLDALTTHESSFFRNEILFRWLSDTGLARLIETGANGAPLSIWSAGCSTGQELLTIGMMLHARADDWRGWTIELLGTTGRGEDQRIEVEVVYGVRRPIDAMWSMVAFQRRQPTWYARLDTVDLPAWIERSISTMVDMREQVPGVVIDFDDLPDGGVVRSVATRLAPGWSDDDVDQWARFANDATSLNRPHGQPVL